MKNKLDQLRGNFEKLKAIGELYEELMAKGVSDEKELEQSVLKYKALKNQALKLSLHSKKIIENIENEDVP